MIHRRGTKLDPPLRLDMSFDEALSRFVATKPQEVDEGIERAKTKRPPQTDPPRRPGRSQEHLRSAPGLKRKPGND
jgi:hypothetical protein